MDGACVPQVVVLCLDALGTSGGNSHQAEVGQEASEGYAQPLALIVFTTSYSAMI